MRFRSTGIFALLVGLLVGYTYFDFQKSKKDEEKKSEQEKILQFKTEDVTKFEIKRKAENLGLEKIDSKWTLTSPLADSADESAVQSLLSLWAQEKGKELSEPGKAINWADFFLDDPGASVEVSLGINQRVSFQISRLAAFDGSYYVRVGDRLLLGSNAWAKVIEKTSSQMRDKTIYRAKGTIAGLNVEVNSGDLNDRVSFAKANDHWTPEKAAPGWQLNETKILAMMDDLVELKATEYVAGASDVAAIKRYGLAKPVSSIRLKFAKSDTQSSDWVLQLGAPVDGAVYGTATGISSIFKVITSTADKFKLARADFRDGHAPFKFALELANQVEIKTEAVNQAFKKEGSDWKLGAEVKGKKLNVVNLQGLFERLQGLEAKEFLDLAKTKGLKPVKNQIVFKSSDGKVVFDLAWGAEYKPEKGPHKGESLIFAKSSLISEAVGLSTDALNSLGVKDLVVDDVPAKPETAPK